MRLCVSACVHLLPGEMWLACVSFIYAPVITMLRAKSSFMAVWSLGEHLTSTDFSLGGLWPRKWTGLALPSQSLPDCAGLSCLPILWSLKI